MRFESAYWDKAQRKIKTHHYSGMMNDYKKFCYDQIINEHNIGQGAEKILVTDVFDEALQCDHLFKRYSFFNKKAVGIDISYQTIRKVKKKYYHSSLVCCDVRKLPFRNEYFDLIVSPSTLDHFPKKHLIMALKELKRVMKNTGKIFLTLNNRNNIWFHFYMLNLLKINPYKYFSYTDKEIREICRELDLKILTSTAICNLPFPIITSRFMNILKLSKMESRKRIFKLIEKLRKVNNGFFTGELNAVILRK